MSEVGDSNGAIELVRRIGRYAGKQIREVGVLKRRAEEEPKIWGSMGYLEVESRLGGGGCGDSNYAEVSTLVAQE